MARPCPCIPAQVQLKFWLLPEVTHQGCCHRCDVDKCDRQYRGRPNEGGWEVQGWLCHMHLRHHTLSPACSNTSHCTSDQWSHGHCAAALLSDVVVGQMLSADGTEHYWWFAPLSDI